MIVASGTAHNRVRTGSRHRCETSPRMRLGGLKWSVRQCEIIAGRWGEGGQCDSGDCAVRGRARGDHECSGRIQPAGRVPARPSPLGHQSGDRTKRWRSAYLCVELEIGGDLNGSVRSGWDTPVTPDRGDLVVTDPDPLRQLTSRPVREPDSFGGGVKVSAPPSPHPPPEDDPSEGGPIIRPSPHHDSGPSISAP